MGLCRWVIRKPGLKAVIDILFPGHYLARALEDSIARESENETLCLMRTRGEKERHQWSEITSKSNSATLLSLAATRTPAVRSSTTNCSDGVRTDSRGLQIFQLVYFARISPASMTTIYLHLPLRSLARIMSRRLNIP